VEEVVGVATLRRNHWVIPSVVEEEVVGVVEKVSPQLLN
jgi:hypothetical protein